jgi:rare lipoprotein A (peptidoglycan hydrolase)
MEKSSPLADFPALYFDKKKSGPLSDICMRYPFLNLFFCLFPLFLLSGCVAPEQQTLSPKRATSRPYVINNQRYTPQHHYELTETGLASHYGGPDGCHGSLTSTGERFNMFELTAAHKTLPLPSVIFVENLENGKSVKLTVNDRGPFIGDRILDVSVEAAKYLGFYEKGLAQVKITTLVDESVALCAAQHMKKRERMICKSSRPVPFTPPYQLSQKIDKVLAQRPHKIYVSITAPSLGRALQIQEKLQNYGQTDLRRTHHRAPLKVVVGPFSTVASAQQVQQELARLYPCTLIHE